MFLFSWCSCNSRKYSATDLVMHKELGTLERGMYMETMFLASRLNWVHNLRVKAGNSSSNQKKQYHNHCSQYCSTFLLDSNLLDIPFQITSNVTSILPPTENLALQFTKYTILTNHLLQATILRSHRTDSFPIILSKWLCFYSKVDSILMNNSKLRSEVCLHLTWKCLLNSSEKNSLIKVRK